MEKMRGLIHAVSVSDEETRVYRGHYKEEAIVLEPHGAWPGTPWEIP